MSEAPIALVTGSTDGLGRVLALRLAQAGMHVLIHGRDAARGEQLRQEIVSRGGQGSFLRHDFSSLDAVRALAERVMNTQGPLQLLINNAGIGTGGRGGGRELSADGYELRFAVNYLAGFFLTRLLIARLMAGSAHVINIASAGQYPLDFENLMLTRAYSGMRAYAQSKLAQILMTLDLAGQLSGVRVNCLHPATYMDTRMVREAGVTPANSVETGADAVLHLALNPAFKGTGLYFDGQVEARAHAQAYDPEARKRLAMISRELCGFPRLF